MLLNQRLISKEKIFLKVKDLILLLVIIINLVSNPHSTAYSLRGEDTKTCIEPSIDPKTKREKLILQMKGRKYFKQTQHLTITHHHLTKHQTSHS